MWRNEDLKVHRYLTGELVKTISVVAYHNNYFLKFSSTFFSPQKSPEPIKKKKIPSTTTFSSPWRLKAKNKKQFCSYDISLEVLIGLVCRISFLGDIIRRNYPVPLPMVNEVWQAFLLCHLHQAIPWDRKVSSRHDPLKLL